MRKIEAHTPLRPADLHQIMARCRVCLRVTISTVDKKPDEKDSNGVVTRDDRKTFGENAIHQFSPAAFMHCQFCAGGTIFDLMQVLPARFTPEEIELQRVQGIQKRIQKIRNIQRQFHGKTSAEIREAIDQLGNFDGDDSFQEFRDEAVAAALAAIADLDFIYQDALQKEEKELLEAEQEKPEGMDDQAEGPSG